MNMHDFNALWLNVVVVIVVTALLFILLCLFFLDASHLIDAETISLLEPESTIMRWLEVIPIVKNSDLDDQIVPQL